MTKENSQPSSFVIRLSPGPYLPQRAGRTVHRAEERHIKNGDLTQRVFLRKLTPRCTRGIAVVQQIH